jgi:hypothetical protein
VHRTEIAKKIANEKKTNIRSDRNDSHVDSFATLIYPPGDLYLSDLATQPDINLLTVDQFTTESCRKKILDLFKIRLKIQQNMTVSGTHDSEVWNFVESALVGFTGFTKIAAYYFSCVVKKMMVSIALSNHLWMCQYAAIVQLAF